MAIDDSALHARVFCYATCNEVYGNQMQDGVCRPGPPCWKETLVEAGAVSSTLTGSVPGRCRPPDGSIVARSPHDNLIRHSRRHAQTVDS